LGSQHARGELPLALRERHLRREPRGDRRADLLLQPHSAGRVLRARPRPRRRLARRRDAALHRQQLRHAAHRRHLRAHPRQASGSDAVPAQERPLPDGVQREGSTMSDLEAAVAAGVLGADEAHRALLQATVEVARAIFGAKAASVFLLDEEADELVFEAVSGEGEGELIGMRFPADTGIDGWVLTTRQPLTVDDLSADTRWSCSQAESTGYVPKSMMSVPLLVEERALGVLQVLDRPPESRVKLREIDLLGLFANQAAIALDLLQRARRARAALAGEGRLAPLARVAGRLEEDERDTALELLQALDRLLAQDAQPGDRAPRRP